MKKKARVNQKQCELVGKAIFPLQFKKEHFERPFLTFLASREIKLRAYLFATAICHQTHTLINKKKNLKGWECLEDVFTDLGNKNSVMINPDFLAGLDEKELSEKLKPLFSEDGNPDNCTLDRLEERAGFMIQISKVLKEKYEGKVENFINKCNNFLSKNKNGLYNLLEDFEAYSDPLKKKSTLFVQLAINSKICNFGDLDSIEPVMDYHMQRLLLRTGCVEILDDKLKKDLQNKQPIGSDEEVRGESVAAVKIISKLANKNYFEVDDILWSIGRSCCKEKILCQDGICNKNPCTFFRTIDMPEHKHCIFESVCVGKNNGEYRKYWQPIVETHYY